MSLTLDQAASALAAVADRKGHLLGYVPKSEDCMYTRSNGDPCCVIGHAMSDLGIGRPAYDEDDNRRRIRHFVDVPDTFADDEAYRLLEIAQEINDRVAEHQLQVRLRQVVAAAFYAKGLDLGKQAVGDVIDAYAGSVLGSPD